MFCGSGGESQGIHWSVEKAGLHAKMFAINHWERAIETHRANFPNTEHICRDVQDIDPSKVIPGRKIALMWASPACTHFSVARGGKPCDDQSRVTPFTVLDWLDKLTVDRLIIENVPEFKSWGPLDEETRRQIPELKGETFNAYISMIRGLGYTVDHKVLNAADYGAPTTRRRLFIQAVRTGSGKSILWPEATHARLGPNSTLVGKTISWVPARAIIDWSLPTQIIDERTKPLAANTMRRIFRGIEKYWGEYATPFLVRYNEGVNRVHSLDNPIPVLDTSNRYGLVQPLVMHIGHTSSNGRMRSIDEPLATVVTKEEACLIEPLFIPQHSCGEVRPTTNPLSTIATKGAIGIVEPLIVEYYSNGVCRPISEPIPVIPTKDRFALITPENARIGFRMLKSHELAAAQSFPRDYIFTGNRGEVIKQIGNAVCPKMAEALTSEYMMELAEHDH
jgi:DNA (cytosine-5)-methyltransferase 1